MKNPGGWVVGGFWPFQLCPNNFLGNGVPCQSFYRALITQQIIVLRKSRLEGQQGVLSGVALLYQNSNTMSIYSKIIFHMPFPAMISLLVEIVMNFYSECQLATEVYKFLFRKQLYQGMLNTGSQHIQLVIGLLSFVNQR